MKNDPIAQLILYHFAELSSELSDYYRESAYLVANELARWYNDQVNRDWISAQMRIRSFYAMACALPGGSDATDDIMTILQVGFFEKLWRHSNAQKTVPTLVNKKALIDSREYYIQWIGREDYERVIKSI